MNLVPNPNAVCGRLVLLAPPNASVPAHFKNAETSPDLHGQFIDGIQRLRGELYLEEGAIQPSQISPDGRHRLLVDERAWHVLAHNRDGKIYGCSRYFAHSNTIQYSQLGVRNSPLALSATWGPKFRAAVESEIEAARRKRVAYVEVGGWALTAELRYTVEALRIALATYSLARLLGGCVGIGAVTLRHCSSSILRRIGGQSLANDGVELPRYFDSQYGCDMEILRFDSAKANPRFEVWIEELCDHLRTTPVIRRESSILRLHDATTDRHPEFDARRSIGTDALQAVQ
jgi:hypothetical protein